MPEIKYNVPFPENPIKQMKDNTKDFKEYLNSLEQSHYYRLTLPSYFIIICAIILIILIIKLIYIVYKDPLIN